ncbi:hypothetical protein [Rickettsia endosymbiont of Orchestes rusci]|uniref:hypothetical protein n=1 Tax=Rickettsia endosymbiont of Orchestes rusci TaxID=3066250 RepID=UPI00313BA3ED
MPFLAAAGIVAWLEFSMSFPTPHYVIPHTPLCHSLHPIMSFPRRRESRKYFLSHPEFISGSFSIDAETSSA